MLLRKQALSVVGAASNDDPRYSLNGILVEPDGSTVATDGHILVKYTPRSQPDTADYPTVEGCDPAKPGALVPFILPSDAAKDIYKAVPKGRKASLPILTDFVAIDVEQTNANGCAVLGVTDLESPRVFRPMKIEGSFPKYENVIPTADKLGPKVGLGVDLLMRICKIAKAQGFECLELQTFVDEPADKPVIFRAKNDKAVFLAVQMPRVIS